MVEVITGPLLLLLINIWICLYILLILKVLYGLKSVPQLLLNLLIIQVHVIQVLVKEIPIHLRCYYFLCRL